MPTLECRSCKKELSVTAYTESGIRNRRCKLCVRVYHQIWQKRNRGESIRKMREYRKLVKDSAFMAYGGYVCKCCGETEEQFLTLDHINDDGGKQRRELGLKAGNQFYVWLKMNNYPPGLLQVLCRNCNGSKHLNKGQCIHQLKKL